MLVCSNASNEPEAFRCKLRRYISCLWAELKDRERDRERLLYPKSAINKRGLSKDENWSHFVRISGISRHFCCEFMNRIDRSPRHLLLFPSHLEIYYIEYTGTLWVDSYGNMVMGQHLFQSFVCSTLKQ